MADTSEPQFVTLAERIAALNRQKNFNSSSPSLKRAPPPPPGPTRTGTASMGPATASPVQAAASVPPLPRRTPTMGPQDGGFESAQPPPTPPLPSRTNTGGISTAAPSLPGRRPSNQPTPAPSPALPPRRPSTQQLSVRRGSGSSDMSHMSNLSSTSNADGLPSRRLPPTLDQANLPPLPPTRRELEAKAKEAAAAAATTTTTTKAHTAVAQPPRQLSPSARPSLPPRLPSRPALGRSPTVEQVESPPTPSLPARRLPPPPSSYTRPTPTLPARQVVAADDGAPPPPVPLASRPSAATVDAVATRPATTNGHGAHTPAAATASCLICRDFSGPDAVAAQYPSHSLPRGGDPVGYLADALCSPFPSATDKARAIFTWCHHNVAYDVDAFFGNRVRAVGTAEVIFSGKAVCEGYAKVVAAIAQRAGLEALVVSGHGKGYGYAPLAPGAPLPQVDRTNHAWSAVRIDGGEWKLMDACWGAGNVKGPGQYEKHFKPEMFFLRNDLFGNKHYPSDPRHFFRADGRRPSWEEYMRGPLPDDEPAEFFTTAHVEGLSEWNFEPRGKHIPVRGGGGGEESVRFQFGKVCEHWRGEVHGPGKPYVLLLKIGGVDGRKDETLAFHTDGMWWWLDVPRRKLGAAGQKVTCMTLEKVNGNDARGWTREMYLDRVGKPGSMGFSYIAAWELV